MGYIIDALSEAMLIFKDLFSKHYRSKSFNYTAVSNEFRETLNRCDYYANCYYNYLSKNHDEDTINFYKKEMTKHQNITDSMLKKYPWLETELYRYYH